jgi:hypothetical protein
MAKHRPLVLSEGGIKQLPATDALPGRPQVALGSGTVLELNTEYTVTLSGDRTVTINGTPAVDDVIEVNIIATAESVFTFPAARRYGSTDKIVALAIPVGNHLVSFKRMINGDWWVADSCGDVTETPYVPPTVATPTFSPVAGTYGAAQDVEFLCDTVGASLHYTDDGSDPDESDPVYSSAIATSANKTYKVRGYKDGHTPSAIATAVYVIDTVAPTLSGTPAVNAAGNRVTFVTSENTTVDTSAGTAVITASGGAVTLSYNSGESTPTNKVWTTSRTILVSETVSDLIYTPPGTSSQGIEDAAGNRLAGFTASEVDNNSTQTSWLVNQNFETPTSGYDNGESWTVNGTGANPVYTPAIVGTQSCRLIPNWSSIQSPLFSPQSDVWAFARIKAPGGLSTQSSRTTIFALLNASEVTVVGLQVRTTDGGTTATFNLVSNGGAISADSAFVPHYTGQDLYVWLHFAPGTGTCSVHVSTTSTKPTADDTSAAFLTGDGASATAVQVYVGNVNEQELIVDRILARVAAIGDNP